MIVKDLLKNLDLGNSVAEFDEELEKFFVETETFQSLIGDRIDIIAGDKGTGKTALYKILQKRYASIPELGNVEVITAFNPSGSPVFQQLAHAPQLTEGQYATLWKSYILSLVGNWLLHVFDGSYTERMPDLEAMLRQMELSSTDDAAATIFSRVVNLAKRLLNPKSAEFAVTYSENGIPIVVPKIEFETSTEEHEEKRVISHQQALGLLNECLREADITVWIAIDRLDEAFVGFPDVEIPALRALLRTYLDLLEFGQVRLKLFVRNDLFRKIVKGGFVNLTHVNSKKIQIVWEEEDLMNLLARRVRGNSEFVRLLNLEEASDQEIFDKIFPAQVDYGMRKARTWSWIMSRIRDGNNERSPRNLIDLIIKAQRVQLRKEEREERNYEHSVPLIEPDSIKRALSELSDARVQDTLLAESGEYAELIEKFKNGKADHSIDSLSILLGVSKHDAKEATKPLLEIGFLEQVGESFKVPILYRDGLNITQGKA